MTFFTLYQQNLINTMIETESRSIKDFYGENFPNYNIFLNNHHITPEKEEIINKILNDAYNLNPYNGLKFSKPELIAIKNNFTINKNR